MGAKGKVAVQRGGDLLWDLPISHTSLGPLPHGASTQSPCSLLPNRRLGGEALGPKQGRVTAGEAECPGSKAELRCAAG